MSEIDVVGLVVLVVFYVVILVFGILATRWYKRRVLDGAADSRQVSLVAGRRLGRAVGIFTMTATTVGGGYINGTAESMATAGLAWTLAPFGILTGLIIGGVVFASKMRTAGYLTMYDPFQTKYGSVMTSLLYLAGICGDVFWSASVLAALGTSLSVIINLNVTVAMVMSAGIAMVYTMFGQVISVAYTDVVQLIFITAGLLLAIPFVFINDAVAPLGTTSDIWLGEIPKKSIATWIDLLITMTLGTIPWQTYFQRVLSVKTARYAQVLSIAGAVGAFILAIPPALIGMAATSTDWNATTLGISPMESGQAPLVLPLCMKHLTPRPVAIIGLSAISAAVMSSVDSAILSSASVFTHNIYKMALRQKASEAELMWVQRVAVVVVGVIATVTGIFVTSIYGIFIMAADIVFVIMFPQLVAVLFIQPVNTYGAMAGYFTGLFIRFTAGEPYLNLTAVIHYPGYNADTNEQAFPHRTFAVVVSLIMMLLVSWLAGKLFRTIPPKYDVFSCFKHTIKSLKELDDGPQTSKDELLPRGEIRGLTFKSYGMEHRSGTVPTQNGYCEHRSGTVPTQNGYCEQNYSENDCQTNCGSSDVAVSVLSHDGQSPPPTPL